MYVCLCNGYRESELRDMARQGYSVAEEAYEAMGDGPCCGHCVDFAQDILDEERAASPAGAMVPAGPMAGDAAA
jgi:bacterioferritin-associated ferredoxin